MELVQIKVSGDMKQRWTEFADSTKGYTSVSGLIRRAVESHIAEEREPDDAAHDIGRLIDEFDDIQAQIGRLQDTLDLTRQEALTEEEVYEFMLMSSYEMIPEYVDEIEKNIDSSGRRWKK